MSIQQQINRLNVAKSNLRTALMNKGVTPPTNASIDVYDDYVNQIEPAQPMSLDKIVEIFERNN